MKTIQNITKGKVSLILVVLFMAAIFNSCTLRLLPKYDPAIAAQVEQTAKQVDKFYLMMQETTSKENDGRIFINFATQYVDIEVELNSMLTKNKIRPLNENSIRICEITLELWEKYKNEHKDDDTLSDGLIKLNRMTFSDLFYAMLVAEKAKDIISNPPE